MERKYVLSYQLPYDQAIYSAYLLFYMLIAGRLPGTTLL